MDGRLHNQAHTQTPERRQNSPLLPMLQVVDDTGSRMPEEGHLCTEGSSSGPAIRLDFDVGRQATKFDVRGNDVNFSGKETKMSKPGLEK